LVIIPDLVRFIKILVPCMKVARALPNWLAAHYFILYSSFGFAPFTAVEAGEVLNTGRAPLLLHKMASYGWADRVDRGVYRLIHPLVALMEISGTGWRDRVRQRDRLPVLELAVARIFMVMGPKLVSIVLFGSLSRGSARPESDIDLLVVGRELPEDYSQRAHMIREIVSAREMDDIIMYLWRRHHIYPELDILLIDEEEANTTHPFYIDLARDSIVIYDRRGVMSRKIAVVRERLERIGAKRFEEPDGSWYWILTPKPEEARVVEL
jgi:predicted nucleotidyltransferase